MEGIARVSSRVLCYLSELAGMGIVTKAAVLIIFAFSSLLLYSGILYRISLKTGRTPYFKLTIAYKFGYGESRIAHRELDGFRNLIPELPRIVILYNGATYRYDCRNGESYAIGIIVCVNDRAVWINHVDTLKMYGFEFAELPGTDHSLLSKFPYCNFLSLCLAAFKMMPRISAYIKSNRLCAHPLVEILDGSQLEFVVPLAQQFDYYVPEAKKYYKMLNIPEQIVIRATPEPPMMLPMKLSKKQCKLCDCRKSVTSSSSGVSSGTGSVGSSVI